jgi:AcrR family transcriptional regulator
MLGSSSPFMTDRRAQILDAARKLLRHYGAQKTTMADIARESDVAVGSLYLEFPSKENILEELSRQQHEEVLSRMRSAKKRASGSPSRAFVLVMTARTDAFFRVKEASLHGCELFHCKVEGVRTAGASFREEERAFLSVLVGEGKSSGAFKGSLDADAVSELVQRSFASLSPPWVFELEERRATRTAEALAELLLSGLAR